MTLRVALVGAGAMGTIMARDVYPSLAGVAEIAAVVDQDRQRAAEAARALGVRHFSTLAEAADQVELSGVDVRLPHDTHADATIAALELGLHVLVEKPLALTTVDCRRIADAARRSGRTVAVAENYPHLRAVRAARTAIEDGWIGDLLALRTTRAYTLTGAWAHSGWRQGDSPMSGLLWDQGTHHCSMLRALGGGIRSVSAHRSVPRTAAGSEVVALDLELTSGLTAQSLYCWGSPGRPVEVEGLVLGTAGYLDLAVSYSGDLGGARLGDATGVRPISVPECYYDSHRWIVEDWAAAADGGRPPRVGVDEATSDVRAVVAAHLSLDQGGALVQLADVT